MNVTVTSEHLAYPSSSPRREFMPVSQAAAWYHEAMAQEDLMGATTRFGTPGKKAAEVTFTGDPRLRYVTVEDLARHLETGDSVVLSSPEWKYTLTPER